MMFKVGDIIQYDLDKSFIGIVVEAQYIVELHSDKVWILEQRGNNLRLGYIEDPNKWTKIGTFPNIVAIVNDKKV